MRNSRFCCTSPNAILINYVYIFQSVCHITTGTVKYTTSSTDVTSLNPIPGTGAFTGEVLPLGENAFGEVDSVLLVGIR